MTGLLLEGLTQRSTSTSGVVKTGTSWTSEGANVGRRVGGGGEWSDEDWEEELSEDLKIKLHPLSTHSLFYSDCTES